MSNYNIYFSPTGGTKKAADILANAMFEEARRIDLCKDIEPMTLCAEDICLISVPSYGGRVPGIALDRLGTLSANGAKAVLVCVYGNRAWDDTLTELQDTLEHLGFVCVAAVAAVAEHSIFRRFAAGRPDARDAAELTQFAAKISEALTRGAAVPLQLPGNHGTYQKYGGVPFKPEGNKHCTGCGICAEHCPTGAIDPGAPEKTDKDRCISCMRCVALCPEHARDLNPLVMKGAAAAMAPVLGGRKENRLFL